MDAVIVIGLDDFSVTGHQTMGSVAERVNKHRNTVSDAMKTDVWVEGGRLVLGDYLVVRVSIDMLKKRGSPRKLHGNED